MKTTKKKIFYTVLELLFTGVAPLVFIITQYSNIGATNEAVGFKMSITGILLAMLVLLVLKRTYLNKLLSNMEHRANDYITIITTETDKEKATRAENALKTIRTAQGIINAILPILVFAAVIIACKALEAQLVELSGCMGLITISYMIGTLFGILAAREVKSKNINKDKANE